MKYRLRWTRLVAVVLLVAIAHTGCKKTSTPSNPSSSHPSSKQDAIFQVPLNSSVGVDYRRLRELLAAKNFKEADRETYEVMLKATKRTEAGFIDLESLNQLPCEDLTTIDQLWQQASDGHFGFSIQQQIYQSLPTDKTTTGDQTGAVYSQFATTIGWYLENRGKKYDELNFSISAPEGHLPASFSYTVAQLTLWREKGLYEKSQKQGIDLNSFGSGMGLALMLDNFLSRSDLCTPAPLGLPQPGTQSPSASPTTSPEEAPPEETEPFQPETESPSPSPSNPSGVTPSEPNSSN